MTRRLPYYHVTTDGSGLLNYNTRWSCCRQSPFFVLLISALEVCVHLYYTMGVMNLEVSSRGTRLHTDSVLVYRPDKRREVWRFLLYMFVHVSWVHLFFNVVVQLLVGIPLEMVHGGFRIALIYIAGVLAGSLATSVFDSSAFLVGASGGVYALIAAHFPYILLNYSKLELGKLKLAAVSCVAAADVFFSVWERYSPAVANVRRNHDLVGYVAHVTGAGAGLALGILVFKNIDTRHRQLLWWTTMLLTVACTFGAVMWNVVTI